MALLMRRLHNRNMNTYSKQNVNAYKFKINSTFTSFYLALVGIIQGIVLSKFIDKHLCGVFKIGTSWDEYSICLLLTLFVIIQITFEYISTSIHYRWFPTVVDIIIPFLLGIFQVSLIYTLKDGNEMFLTCWYLDLFIICILGCGSYLHTLLVSKAVQLPPDEDSISNFYIYLSIALVMLAGFVSFIGYIMPSYNCKIYVLYILSLLFIIISIKEHMWLRDLCKLYKLRYGWKFK